MEITRSRLALLPLLFAIPAALTLGACGGDDATVGPATTGSGDDGVSPGAAYGSECSPVGQDREAEATETVEIQVADYVFVPSEVDVTAGVVTFAVTNVGDEAHEVAFLPGGGQVPFTEDGAPNEQALAEGGAFELEAFPAGEECRATYDLQPGRYTLFCIVEAPDGETHYEKGMVGELTVS